MGPEDECPDWINAFTAARGDKMAKQTFAKLLWTLVIIINIISI